MTTTQKAPQEKQLDYESLEVLQNSEATEDGQKETNRPQVVTKRFVGSVKGMKKIYITKGYRVNYRTVKQTVKT